MTVTSMIDSVKKAPAAVATVVAVVTVLAWFGFKVQFPGDRLDKHLMESDKAHAAIASRQDSAHAHDETMQALLEGMARGECIENPKEDLARQGLLSTCRRLGIER